MFSIELLDDHAAPFQVRYVGTNDESMPYTKVGGVLATKGPDPKARMSNPILSNCPRHD